MTKIILAFPCMGKTYYTQNHPEKALDLESSDYLFDKTSYEHLSSEEFKGIPNRKPKENGVADYLKAIDEDEIVGDKNGIVTKIEYGTRKHTYRPLGRPVLTTEKSFVRVHLKPKNPQDRKAIENLLDGKN